MPDRPEMESSIALLRYEAAFLGGALAVIPDAWWTRETACTDWTISDVVAHLVQGADGAAVSLARAQGGDPSPPPGQRILEAGERASAMTAERAIAYRGEQTPREMRTAYDAASQRLCAAAGALQGEDWEKPSFHRRGIIPVHENITRRIQEIAIHGWDLRYAVDPASEISEGAAAAIMAVSHRWLNACFTPIGQSARFRFAVSGEAGRRQDVVLAGDSFSIEDAADTPADVTFRCNASAYVLLTYGRLDLSGGAPATAQLEIDGPLEKALLFTTAFAGY